MVGDEVLNHIPLVGLPHFRQFSSKVDWLDFPFLPTSIGFVPFLDP